MGDTTDLNSLRPVLLPMDAAAVRVRRVLAKMVRDEQQTESLKPQQVGQPGSRASV
jgi:hypothetical protein